MDGLKEQMLDFYEKNGINGWIVKCDIHKYFYSIWMCSTRTIGEQHRKEKQKW